MCRLKPTAPPSLFDLLALPLTSSILCDGSPPRSHGRERRDATEKCESCGAGLHNLGGKIIQLSMICKYTPAPYLDVVPEVLERHQSLLFTEPRCQPQPSITTCKLVGGARQRLQWLHVHRRPPPSSPPSCIRRADGVSLWVMMYVCRRIFVIFLFTNKSEIIAWLQLPDSFVPDRPTRSG